MCYFVRLFGGKYRNPTTSSSSRSFKGSITIPSPGWMSAIMSCTLPTRLRSHAPSSGLRGSPSRILRSTSNSIEHTTHTTPGMPSTGPFMPPGHLPSGLMLLSSGGLASLLAGSVGSGGELAFALSLSSLWRAW